MSHLTDTRPASVSNATGLFCIGVGMGVIRTLLDWPLLTRDSSPGFVLLALAFTFGTLLLLIHYVDQGRNWARITLLVLFLLGLPFALGPLVEAVGLGMLFAPDARRWFDPAERLHAERAEMKKVPVLCRVDTARSSEVPLLRLRGARGVTGGR